MWKQIWSCPYWFCVSLPYSPQVMTAFSSITYFKEGYRVAVLNSFSAHTCPCGFYDTWSCQALRAIIESCIEAIKDKGEHKGQRGAITFSIYSLTTEWMFEPNSNIQKVASYLHWKFASLLRHVTTTVGLLEVAECRALVLFLSFLGFLLLC